MHPQDSAPRTVYRGRLERKKSVLAVAVLTLSSAFGLVISSGAANASSAHKSAAASLKSLEKTLSTLEHGYPAGATLTEAGSSLIYPLMVEWEGHGLASGISPAAGGSGKGQSGAESGTIDIGGSDPFLPSSTLQADGVLNIPLTVSAQLVNYNIPGLSFNTHVHLNGTVLSEMYSGQITHWNDPAIVALNKGVHLPSLKIVPLHRSDSSGDTFLFTNYLYDQDPSGVAQGGPTQLLNWPNVPGSLAENGNGAMQATCITTPGCVAYIGISYQHGSTKGGLGYAALKNGYKGKGGAPYVLPTTTTINAEVASFKHIPSNGGVSLINSSSSAIGYPIVNFEYVIVKQSSSKAAAIKGFLAWAMDPRQGSAPHYLDPVLFRPLPVNALAVAVSLLHSIR